MELWTEECEGLREEARTMVAAALGALSDGLAGQTDPDASVEDKVAAARGAMSMFGATPVPEAEPREIAGVPCRVFTPDGPATAVYLHFHGGGMIMGEPVMNDTGNLALTKDHGVAVVSVDYRLAPEHPFPAGPDAEAGGGHPPQVGERR